MALHCETIHKTKQNKTKQNKTKRSQKRNEKEMKKFYAQVSKNDNEYVATVNASNMKTALEYIKNDGYTPSKCVDAATHHLCKYCGGIAEGTYEDLLCIDCRECFGHTMYSEL